MDTTLTPNSQVRVLDVNSGTSQTLAPPLTASAQSSAFSQDEKNSSQQHSSKQAFTPFTDDSDSSNNNRQANSAGSVDREQAQDALQAVLDSAKQAQSNLQRLNTTIEFSVDEDTGRDVVTLKDKNSQEVIKQFPTEEVLTVLKQISELTGSLMDTEA
jgi:flagellar protein FlaG